MINLYVINHASPVPSSDSLMHIIDKSKNKLIEQNYTQLSRKHDGCQHLFI